jgi:hypothetical protein
MTLAWQSGATPVILLTGRQWGDYGDFLTQVERLLPEYIPTWSAPYSFGLNG